MSASSPDDFGPAIDWSPVPRSRAHELVIDAIEDQVMAGRLTVGDSLPPERDLATKLEVSRASVREAIRVLESQGVLQSRVGSGRSAGTVITAMPSAALTRLLRMHVGLSNFPVDDVVEVRVALERASVLLAAEHADEERLAAIREPLDRMESAEVPLEEFNDADTAFHVAIAEAAGNRLVADLTTAIRSSLRQVILRAFHDMDDSQDLRQSLQAQHREIYAAIAAGDGPRGTRLTEEHIRFAHRALPEMRRPAS